MSGSVTGLLQPRTQEALRKLLWRLRDRRAVSSTTGSHASIFRGRGLEFDQVVRYVYGDDVRDIDWNVTARLGQPYRKCFIEEREVVVFVVFDDEPALQFGSGARSKREVMIELVAFALLLATIKRERIGFLHRTRTGERRLEPTRNRARVLQEIGRLIEEPAVFVRGHTTVDLCPTPIAGVPPGALVLRYGEIPLQAPSLAWHNWARHYELIGIRVEDPWERDLPRSMPKVMFDPAGDALVSGADFETMQEAHRKWRDEREAIWNLWWPQAAGRWAVDSTADTLAEFVRLLKLRGAQQAGGVRKP